MNWFYVLLIICYELSERRIFVSLKPTDEPFTTPPENYPTENSVFGGTQEINIESETSVNTIPNLSDFSGICPNSNCPDYITEYRDDSPLSRACYCDKLCIGLRDCCKDSVFYDEEEQRQPRTLDCERNGNVLYEYNGFYVERGCSYLWEDSELVEKCAMSQIMDLNTADLELMVPVTSRSTGVTYGNIFCAICNNDGDFIAWNIILNYCNANEQNIEDYEIVDNENDSFVTEVEEKEGSTKMENIEYTEQIIKDPEIVDNKNDSFVTEVEEMEDSTEMENIEYTNNKMGENAMQPKNSLDLKFNGKHWYITENRTEYICRLILSRPNDIELNTCEINEEFKYLIIDSCEKNWTDSTVLTQCQGAYDLVYHNIPGKLSKIFKNKFCAYCNGLNDTQIFCEPNTISLYRSGFDIGFSSVSFNFNKNFSNTEYCRKIWANGKSMTALAKRFCPTDTRQSEFLEKTSNSNLKLYQLRSYDTQISGQRFDLGRATNINNRNQFITVEFNFDTKDKKHIQGYSLNGDRYTSYFGSGRAFSVIFDYNLNFSNTENCRKAWAKGKNKTASKKQFCSTNAQQSEFLEETSNWFFTSYTSIALLVSLIFLICHLTVFTVVEKLHTIGGKIIASFCLALILAYSNFLAGNYLEGNACFVVSIVTYYSFLSAFSWMFTISFDIWKTFRDLTKKLKSPRNPKYKFLKYSIWSWTMPALVVSTAVYFDLSQSHSDLAPHFGEEGCWFHNKSSLLLFFVVPVSVIILINFVLFLHVSLILRGNQCKSANQKAYVDFKLYARISLLTGFTWITGFIAGYFQNIVIWYIFIFLNTGQGFLIFLCFTCKKEIISIALQKIGLSCCLIATCKKFNHSTEDSNVKTENSPEIVIEN